MSDKPISSETRKVVGGWHAIQAARQQGKSSHQIKQERLLNEREENPSQSEQGFKPGEEESNEGFSSRRAKQHMQKLFEQKQSERIFKGNSQQIALKLQILTEGDADTGAKGGHKVKVLGCESAGLGIFKLTYLLVD